MDQILERLDRIENALEKELSIGVYVDQSLENAKLPSRAHLTDSGFDLYNAGSKIEIGPQSSAVVNTGVILDLPEGIEAQVRPRSGLARNHMISILNTPGTVDSGYRGYVQVILFNNSCNSFDILPGMRIAQVVFARVLKVSLKKLNNKDEITNTDRSAGGFGSTGV